MSNSGTTSIASLPAGDIGQDPIQLVAQDIQNETAKAPSVYSPQVQPSPAAGLMNQNDIVKSLNKPGINAMTRFPEQDVVMSTSTRQTNVENRQEYIPVAQTEDYIADHEIAPPIQSQSNGSSETDLDSFKVPLLVAACFFLFQTSAVQRAIYCLLPDGQSVTGGLTLQNQLLLSALFGLTIYGGMEVIEHIDY